MTALHTSLGKLTVEQARSDELNIVMGIIEEAAAWLHSHGVTEQWPSPIPKAAWAKMASRVAEGDVYLARLPDDKAIGTFRFEWFDSDLWRHDPAGGGYVHSFAICDCAHGHGVGAAMIEWAKQHVREHGRKYLRLDCWGANQPLCKHYEELGFMFCGTIYDEDGPNALWQMEV